MPVSNAPTELGGRVNAQGVQPAPHVPTVAERLRLIYMTGDDSGTTPYDGGEVFSGLIPYEEKRAEREAAGDLVKGEEWEVLVQEGETAVAALAAEPG